MCSRFYPRSCCVRKVHSLRRPDALIANKLLELGVTVNPNNVDWYKRTPIEQQSAAAAAAAAAANGGAQ